LFLLENFSGYHLLLLLIEMSVWTQLPKAAAARGVTFKYQSGFFFSFNDWTSQFPGKAAHAIRYLAWNYFWSGREYGLLFNDQYFEPAPEVQEALRRLCLQEPHEFDQRKIRLTIAHTLAMNNERLPKDKWTRWDDVSCFFGFLRFERLCFQETFYLQPYLNAINAEKTERVDTSGLLPGYQVKAEKKKEH
jgi:hypothetical protein